MKAEIKFANTNNGPKAFVKTFDDNWNPINTPLKAYKRDMRSIKPTSKYEEGKGYTVAVSPWVLAAFLEANDLDGMQMIRGKDLKAPPVGNVRYANEEEVVWYEFSSANATRRCTDLSRAKGFVQEWVNLDCPTLTRFSSNQKNLSVNGWGIALPVFQNRLVESYGCEMILDSDLRIPEINGILKHVNPNGAVAAKMRSAREIREAGPEGLRKAQEEMEEVYKNINILLHEVGTRDAILDAQNAHKDEAKMLDCGWLNWVPTPGTELAHKFDLLRDSGKGRIFMDIDMPIADQSVTVQSYGGDLVRKLVKDTFGYDISYYRHLD